MNSARQGGWRAGSGRKPYPGTLVSRSVTLTEDQWRIVNALGVGNSSKGIRAVIDSHEETQVLLSALRKIK